MPFLYAQSDFTFMLNKEGKLIALPKRVHFDFNIPQAAYKSYTPATTRMIDEVLKNYAPVTNPKLDERPIDMQTSSQAYEPLYHPHAHMLRRVSPTAFDFHEVEYFPLNENFTFVVSGRQQTWPGLGGQTTVNTALNWQSGSWQIDGSGFAGRYFTPFNPSPEFVSGANIHTSFQATDWLKLNAWGQYAGYNSTERRNPHMLMSPFFYHNSFGTAVEFKLNENFGMGAGVQYDFNPMNRKWERQVLLFPVFY
jgi:hypothetical protein